MYLPGCFFFFVFVSSVIPCLSYSKNLQILTPGSSLSVEKSDNVLISPDGGFAAGFFSVGDNTYCFGVWFTESADPTVVWMANRDKPVNGRRSELALDEDGNLVLTDAGLSNVWTAYSMSTTSSSALRLLNTGNLVLQTSTNLTLWQSFDYPTDTLLPNQSLTRYITLLSQRSRYNYSSGYYSLIFDNDNVLCLLYNSPDISNKYWPDPSIIAWEVGRTLFNDSRTAGFDSAGHFLSSDQFEFFATDFGIGPKRRLTMDFDGNLRLYSLDDKAGTWVVSWQALPPCGVHGLCGPNGICVYALTGWMCSCPPGFKAKDPTDLSQGCQPIFNLSCDPQEAKFIELHNIDFYGYDMNSYANITLEICKSTCLNLCTCKVFQYTSDNGGSCFNMAVLFNGRQSPSSQGIIYLKVPKDLFASNDVPLSPFSLECSNMARKQLVRVYELPDQGNSLKHLFWFIVVVGGLEIICIFLGWRHLYKKHKNSNPVTLGHLYDAAGFRKFTYSELQIATSNFCEVIGRGGGGVVYKGVLTDQQVVAVKQLQGVNQGEAEFFAEVSTIGRINHMNLIQMLGFCAEGKHRLLVYEYMENGSLAENLSSKVLDWNKRFKIAVGIAKGLAYLHEECLEWVLHCDIKPHNILLDDDNNAKVSDFGLSKLRDRGRMNEPSFSRARGTRGYMAPEWILNLPITSKVDVYSYGIVLLEMVTGKCSTGLFDIDYDEGEKEEYKQLVPWVKKKIGDATVVPWRIEEILDPQIDSEYDVVKMEVLVKVALQCVEEEKDERPTMSQVVEMLLS